jgi:hypothetical protein
MMLVRSVSLVVLASIQHYVRFLLVQSIQFFVRFLLVPYNGIVLSP